MSTSEGSPTVERVPDSAISVFGDSWPKLEQFAAMLVAEGELRGLIGPRELPRLWTRHLLNSSAVAPFVPEGVAFADIGSGAGFPGIVVAIMRPDLDVHLIEPMERRTTWLEDVSRELSLSNVTVVRARAEELHGAAGYDAVSARAVAALKKLVPWVGPLIAPGGRLVALKGERAAAEVIEAEKMLRKHGLRATSVQEVVVPGTDEPTRIVIAERVG
ncbi:16S rRNA (guanine(527)-N(7))-methyltransferase RsmG [Georgenia satyanarayanai]|uniref:16S rRNA (guanine(527)-N(7))-methyltransferase RsmG n=1 Tax=Georgenia satyanarayanai TaxID=860221 RepID=UPI00203E01AF|nr:16S rRNA (guanine(527)-N(7))-methyltransferase RsmG [Georgenia satyanarayanai]MCM3661152.1 16S rRNA (guanine(527)-N(7))-methyltransferase RsmG [Georgenia satyanarayanai]